MKVLAFDYGASSGRAMLGEFDGSKIELSEIHRFLNEPVSVNGALYWDILRLYHELKQGILKADRMGGASSMGIDTWGVDFGLLGKDGQLLANPFHYRHSHTEHAVEELEKKLSKKEIYSQVGLAFQKFNTLCQLVVMRQNGNAALNDAEDLLFIPDLFNYFLTGEKMCEFTIASTSQLINPGENSWNEKIFKTYGINEKLFKNIVSPATFIGEVGADVAKELSLSHRLPVIASAEHDTASAFVSVPAKSKNCAFLSSGTWSLLGAELDKPILTEEAMLSGYTNEGGLGNNIRFLKNIMGLWIIQECKRYWDKAGENVSFAELAEGAQKVPACKYVVNPDDEAFFTPGEMPVKIADYCRSRGGEVPQSKYEIARCVFDSLALAYKHNVKYLEKLTGRSVDVLHIVGGGSNNSMLNQATADALGKSVTAGPSEGTALGNMLTQLIALKEISGIDEAREVVRNSTEIRTFTPANSAVYEDAYAKFLKLI